MKKTLFLFFLYFGLTISSVLLSVQNKFSNFQNPNQEQVENFSKSSAPKTLRTLDYESWYSEISQNTALINQWKLKEFYYLPNQEGGQITLLSEPGIEFSIRPSKAPVKVRFESIPGAEKEKYDSSYIAEDKDFRFHVSTSWNPYRYDFFSGISIKNMSSKDQVVHPNVRITVPYKNQAHPSLRGIVKAVGIQSQEEGVEFKGPVYWAGLEDRYFLRAIFFLYSLFTEAPDIRQVHFKEEGGKVLMEITWAAIRLKPGERERVGFHFYLGPKDPTYLPEYSGAYSEGFVSYDLKDTINHSWIVVPSLKYFKKIHHYIPNWALVLCLVAISIHLIFYLLLYPFFYYSKYRLWPLYLQLPIFFIVYQITYYGIPFRFEPFLFYQDLASPDPYFILPVLCGLAFFLLYFISPKPASKKIDWVFKMAPLLLVMLGVFLPLGLVWYIFISLLMALLLQWFCCQKLKKGNSENVSA